MNARLALLLLRRAGFAGLAAGALGWWAFHIDAVTRAERAAAEQAFRAERSEDRSAWQTTLKEIAPCRQVAAASIGGPGGRR